MLITSPRRRHGLLAIIALLLAADIALLVTYALRQKASLPRPAVEIEPNDPRAAPVFAALETGGLAAALDTLERRASTDSLVLRGGHQLAHALGRRAFLLGGGDAAVLQSCRPAFASGCYHGVVEALLNLRGRIDMPQLHGMCSALGSDDAPGPVYECVHGLGHGVLGAVAMDVGTALRHCDSLDEASFAASCHEGVFMEAIGSAPKPPVGHAGHQVRSEHDHAVGLVLETGDPYSPCDRYSDPYAESCWLFQGFVILRRVNFEPAVALSVCDRAHEGRVERCYESVGHQLAGLFQRGDAWIIEQCMKARAELAPRCASGAALALASLDWSGRRVVVFCSTVPNAWMSACTRTAAKMLAQLSSPAQRAALCGSSQREYSAICKALNEPRRTT